MRGKTKKRVFAFIMQILMLTNFVIPENVTVQAQEKETVASEQETITEQTPDEQVREEEKEETTPKDPVDETENDTEVLTTPIEKTDQTEQTEETQAYREGKILVVFQENTLQKRSANMQKAANAVAESNDMNLVEFYQFKENNETTDQQKTLTTSNVQTQTTQNAEGELFVGVLESENKTTEQMLQQVESRSDILMAEPVYICKAADLTNDSYIKEQWAVENAGQNGGSRDSDLHPDILWNGLEDVCLPVTGTEKVIAVVDTGIDYTNPEFSNNIWVNPYQGVLPGEHGYDFVNDDKDPMDDNGHGTHTSGIIAAEGNNGIGITGISQKAKIMALKFLDENGVGDTSLAIQAYQYIYDAIQVGVPVTAVNNSWTGGYSRILQTVVDKVGEANVVSVFAAGNESKDMDTISNSELGLEETATVESPYAVSVAATNEKGEMAQFSNYGKKSVTLAAPGCDILSTVEKPVFNPGIYDASLQKRLCDTYQSYERGFLPFYDKKEDGCLQARTEQRGYPLRVEVRKDFKTNRSDAQMQVETTNEEYFGSGEGAALRVSVKGAKKGDTIYVSIPYSLAIDQKSDPAISFQTKMIEETADPGCEKGTVCFYDLNAEDVEGKINDGMLLESAFDFCLLQNGGSGQYWNHTSKTVPANTSDHGKKKMLVAQIFCPRDGDYTLYMDDFGVTKGESEEQKWYGTYEFLNGTSMAAPYVTGIVALLGEAYPKLTAKERIQLLKSCIKKTEELKSVTQNEGILDLQGLQNPIPMIYEAEYDKNDQLCISGYGFQNGATSVWINGKEQKADVKKSTQIVIDASEYKNRQVQLCIKTAFGSSEKTCYLVKKSMTYKDSTTLQWNNGSQDQTEQMRVVSDGTYLYLYRDSSQNIFQMTMQDQNVEIVNELYFDAVDEWEEDTLDTPKEYHIVSNLVSLNGRLYALLASKEVGSSYQQIQLISIKTGKSGMTYTEMGELPAEYKNRSDMTLGAYNGKLYLIGGYDYGKKSLSTSVMVAVDPTKKNTTWKKAPSLPSGRAAGECIQSGKKLYYALGAAPKAENSCPRLLSFDGKVWKEEGAQILALKKTTRTYQQTEYDVYDGNLGICKEGLLFTGLACDGLGDTFYYNISKKTYQAAEYHCIENIDSDQFAGTVVEDQLIGLAQKGGETSLCSMKVKSGSYTVTAGKKGSGTVTINKKKVIPGEKITITLTPKKGCCVQEFQVNGKKVSGKKKTLYATANVKIKVVFVKKKKG